MHSPIWQRFQVNHWILNTCLVVGVQSIYISYEVTDRVKNIYRQIVDCCEDVFIERQLCIWWFWRWCQVNHRVLNTCFIVRVKNIDIRDEVANRVTKYWSIFSWLLWRCLYLKISWSKLCLSLYLFCLMGLSCWYFHTIVSLFVIPWRNPD